MKLLVKTCLGSANIVAFVDGNPLIQGKLIQGNRIVAPEALSSLPSDTIIIGSLLHQSAISNRIRQSLNLTNKMFTLE